MFKLAPNGGGGYTESVLCTFNSGSDGAFPVAGLIVDSAGNFYGTTTNGGGGGSGTVFKLAPRSGGGYTESVYYGFSGSGPVGGVIRDSAGNLFGTTGTFGDGTVFEVYPH